MDENIPIYSCVVVRADREGLLFSEIKLKKPYNPSITVDSMTGSIDRGEHILISDFPA